MARLTRSKKEGTETSESLKSQWERWIKRYIWDDERTPYLVSPARMSESQARYEIFAYAVFLACLFFIAALASASSPPVAFYALSVVAAAVILGFTKHPSAAAYTATAPLAAALHLLFDGMKGDLGHLDLAVIAIMIVLWTIYSFRIINIARTFRRT